MDEIIMIPAHLSIFNETFAIRFKPALSYRCLFKKRLTVFWDNGIIKTEWPEPGTCSEKNRRLAHTRFAAIGKGIPTIPVSPDG
jgi:hypothetical protein